MQRFRAFKTVIAGKKKNGKFLFCFIRKKEEKEKIAVSFLSLCYTWIEVCV